MQRASWLGLAVLLPACAAATRVPAPPAAPVVVLPADTPRVGYTAADVRFMQGMIHHHAQAVEMSALVPSRTSSRSLLLLAERIDVSQKDEMARMQGWLRVRSEEVPSMEGGHAHHGALMPGMLSPAEMERLRTSSGADFDRRFLEWMIRHHEGALTMVAELFAAGGGQEPELYQFASDVDADQRAEIARMRSLLTP